MENQNVSRPQMEERLKEVVRLLDLQELMDRNILDVYKRQAIYRI